MKDDDPYELKYKGLFGQPKDPYYIYLNVHELRNVLLDCNVKMINKFAKECAGKITIEQTIDFINKFIVDNFSRFGEK